MFRLYMFSQMCHVLTMFLSKKESYFFTGNHFCLVIPENALIQITCQPTCLTVRRCFHFCCSHSSHSSGSHPSFCWMMLPLFMVWKKNSLHKPLGWRLSGKICGSGLSDGSFEDLLLSHPATLERLVGIVTLHLFGLIFRLFITLPLITDVII